MNVRRPPRSKRVLVTLGCGVLWISTLGCGLRVLLAYEGTPGTVGKIHSHWPDASAIPRPNEKPALVMVAHPFCPCTRASMDEFAKIMARVQGKVSAYVLFLRPGGGYADWETSDLCRKASNIPGVTVLFDRDGREAQQFGAETSGHTFLYNRDGFLLYSGGVTCARGHAGDNLGEEAIINLVEHQGIGRTDSFVFGCSLLERQTKQNHALCSK